EEEDEEDPVDTMISRTGCATQHQELQECMAQERDWRFCQNQLRAFRDCMVHHQRLQD
ncbi:COA4 factor, partial [Turnix velox]|nr:COA4 factor [Turnix velox]